jgi:hypothetical protein
MKIPAFCVRSSMFKKIEPNIFLILLLIVRESSSGEKVIKNGNRMRFGANYFQNLGILKKMPAFCVRSSMFEQKLYRNSFKSCHQLPDKKVEEK